MLLPSSSNLYETRLPLAAWLPLSIISRISFFFDFSVREAVEDEQTQDNFSYISTNAISFWNSHLKTTAHYLWDDVFIDLLWESFTENLTRLKDGEPTIFEELAPNVDGFSNAGDDTNMAIGKNNE